MKNQKIITIPNILSLFRLLLVPVFIWLYAVRHDDTMAIVTLAVSGVTDILDGQIARRFNMISELGKMLDPVADKVTQGAVLICLLTRFPAMWVPLVILAVKDVFVSVSNLMILKQTGRVHGAEIHGKIATVLLYALMLAHLLWGHVMSHTLSIALIAITTCSLLTSLWLYVVKNTATLKRLKNRKENQPNER